MNVPVYIVTGFLGAGKTRFITDMLTDEGFSEGEKTLLLCCEEGEEEYDPEALKKGNATLVNLDDPKQIAGKRLMRMNREHQPERVPEEHAQVHGGRPEGGRLGHIQPLRREQPQEPLAAGGEGPEQRHPRFL